MAHYTEKLRDLRINNPTLRDCFDPFCSEYNDSTFEEKIETLQKVIANGFSLQQIVKDYCKYYNSQTKPYVAKDLNTGLTTLIDELLNNYTKKKLTYADKIYSNEELIIILTSQLKDTTRMTIETKKVLYKEIVEDRKKHVFADTEIKNPSELGITNDDHLNAWSYWHGDLNAEILLIGQDFGDYSYYINNDGKDDPKNPTSLNLNILFKQAGIDIGDTDNPTENAKLYFTNAVLGAKSGGMATAIKKDWYADTATKFLKPLIDLVQPKIIIAMGSIAYDAVSIIYNIEKKAMKDVIETNPILLPDNKKLFVVYHCSNLGIANRNFELQKADWKKIGEHKGE
jgi:hypothetical protein